MCKQFLKRKRKLNEGKAKHTTNTLPDFDPFTNQNKVRIPQVKSHEFQSPFFAIHNVKIK